jgi:hypothetical protein
LSATFSITCRFACSPGSLQKEELPRCVRRQARPSRAHGRRLENPCNGTFES